jgi:hypothetical protein
MTRRWWWPLGPHSVVVPSIAIVVVVLGTTWPRLDWPYPLWTQTSAQFHQQFALAGMIAGTAACWYATVMHAKDRIWVRPGAPRLGVPAVSRHLTTLLCWFVSAYLIALTPLVVSTLVHDAVGAPDPLVMVSGVLALAAAVTLGYALGTVVSSIAMVPVVAVAFYALLVAGNIAGEPLAAVAPSLWMEPQAGDRESLPLVVFRIALFLAVAIAAVPLAARAMACVRVWRSMADVALCLAVPAILVVVALVRPPVAYITDAMVSSCAEHREIRYCVHRDNGARLEQLVRTVDPVIARFGIKPSNVDEVRDESLIPRFAEIEEGVETALIEPDGTISTSVTSVAGGLYACDWEENYDNEEQLVTELKLNITTYLETGTPSGSLASMTVGEVQEWLAVHQEQLHDCTLTVDQLPGASAR